MPPELILDPERVDLGRVLADRDELRRVNPQRFEMEQLDAIVCMDPERETIVGYKDVRADEFWTRGHMPGFPLLPGVLMCEAAAQLVGYYVTVCGFKVGDYIGFAGMENVRFRGGHFTTWLNHRYPRRVCALAIERKKSFMDEWSAATTADAVDEPRQALAATLSGLLEELQCS